MAVFSRRKSDGAFTRLSDGKFSVLVDGAWKPDTSHFDPEGEIPVEDAATIASLESIGTEG